MKTLERDYSKLEAFSRNFSILNECIAAQQENPTRTTIKANVGKMTKDEIRTLINFLQINMKRKLDSVVVVDDKTLLINVRSNRIKERTK